MYCTISIIEIPHTIQEKITAFITGAATLGIICKNTLSLLYYAEEEHTYI